MKTLKNFAVGIALIALVPASIFAEADTEFLKTNKIVKVEKVETDENVVEVKELTLPILTSKKPADMNNVSYSSKVLVNPFAEGIKESNKKSELKKDNKNKTKKSKTKKKSKKKSKKNKKKKLIGNFKITAYCIHGRTASGTTTTANRTIAADPSVLPYGTEVVINGKTYVVEDTGGAIKNNRIDIYMSTYDEAIQWGVRNIDVYYAK